MEIRFEHILGVISLGLILQFVILQIIKYVTKKNRIKRIERSAMIRENMERNEINNLNKNNISTELDNMLLDAKNNTKKVGW